MSGMRDRPPSRDATLDLIEAFIHQDRRARLAVTGISQRPRIFPCDGTTRLDRFCASGCPYDGVQRLGYYIRDHSPRLPSRRYRARNRQNGGRTRRIGPDHKDSDDFSSQQARSPCHAPLHCRNRIRRPFPSARLPRPSHFGLVQLRQEHTQGTLSRDATHLPGFP